MDGEDHDLLIRLSAQLSSLKEMQSQANDTMRRNIESIDAAVRQSGQALLLLGPTVERHEQVQREQGKALRILDENPARISTLEQRIMKHEQGLDIYAKAVDGRIAEMGRRVGTLESVIADAKSTAKGIAIAARFFYVFLGVAGGGITAELIRLVGK